jgi:hypothetical protein
MIDHTLFQNVALAISAYSDELYTNAKKITGTGIIGSDARISGDGESFIGQMRWYKPLSPNINVASLTDSADGTRTDTSTDIADYIKTVRTFGSQQVNLQQMISKQDGLMKIARDAVETRTEDEHGAVLSVLKGIAAYEASIATSGGIVAYDTAPSVAGNIGMFVDLNANGVFGAAATAASDERKLIDATASGAAKGERLFKALGMAFKDYEPDYMYMITSPETLAELRAANLVDDVVITEGNLNFQTIFGGKFRLLLTRAAQGNNAASANVNDRSTKTTFLVKPGAVHFSTLAVPTPVEVVRAPAAYKGGGTTDIWYRYGFITHPWGYDWAGSTSAFASNTNYGTAGSWARKLDYLNLGILPIFHA